LNGSKVVNNSCAAINSIDPANIKALIKIA
jgi:hypothetical protein